MDALTQNLRRKRPVNSSFLLLLSAFIFTFTGAAATIVKTSDDAKGITRYQDVVDANSLGDPLTGASSCTPGRGMTRTFVCDASALLAPRSTNRIDSEIQRVYTAKGPYKRAVCTGQQMNYGYLIEVAVVRRMDSGPDSARSFASSLFLNWKVGDPQATCGNGVLILISLEDRQYFFATGDNVQRIMGRKSVSRVENALVKYLRKNNIYMAVLNAVMVLGKELASNTHGGSSPAYVPPTNNYGTPSSEVKNEKPRGPWSYIVILIVAAVGVSLGIAAYNSYFGKEAALRRKQAPVEDTENDENLETIKDESEMESAPLLK